MPDFSRRSIILGTAGIAAAGAGVTAAAGLQGSVEGQADVQAEQALTVAALNIAGDQDAEFTRTSDDNTTFQGAVELNNGDSVEFSATIENSAADPLDIQVTVDAPDPIDIEVRRTGNNDDKAGDPGDVDDNTDDDSSESDNGVTVQTGEGTFISTIPGTDSSSGNGKKDIDIHAELDDTAEPGSYDIGVAINPLSTDN